MNKIYYLNIVTSNAVENKYVRLQLLVPIIVLFIKTIVYTSNRLK